MGSPLALLSADQATIIDNVDAYLNQAFLSGVTDQSGGQLVPQVPALQQYGTLSSALQTQTQAAMRSGFSALLVAMNYSLPVGGASGTITLAKLTGGGSNGSITVSNGIITAFTNPT
jgi:hypothetical protein